MSRFIGSIFKKSRQLGLSLLETNKEFSKWKARTTPPGQHGASGRRKKTSVYGDQLREKRKIALMYGLTDVQLRRYFKAAKKLEGSLADNLLNLLERRVDNMVFRMNFAPTRRAARQLVSHGHVMVNGKRLNIPSAWVNIGDKISLSPKLNKLPYSGYVSDLAAPEYLDVDSEKKEGVILRYPRRNEISSDLNEVYVVEWYKRLV